MSVPELLAPAGELEALHAAVAGGADAVYLGIDRLNARRNAQNFTLETLAGACEFAHLRGVSVYLTANVLILPEELDDAVAVVEAAWRAGVDAVIVQDLGLLHAIREWLPGVRVHASTQIDAHSSGTVRALSSLGVARVTLAREVSVDEIATLVRVGTAHGVEVESFVHGAICVCYSGQCLLSSLIGSRSANRGMCAQPCRLPYELVDAGGEGAETPGAHLLSPRDLAGITVLDRLVETGVAALKIEGRMKSAEYVSIVTRTYRDALDRAVHARNSYEVRDGERAVLSEAFSRGFTEAYLVGERGNDMMSYRRPNNRGVAVGRIVSVDGSLATIALDAPLDAEDSIEVWTSRGRFAQAVGEMRAEGTVRPGAARGERIAIVLQEPASAGDRLFRVRNAALSAAARRTFVSPEDIRPVEVSFRVRVVIGEPLLVEATAAGGVVVTAMGSVIEEARTRPVETADVIEHVGRVGGTPFLPVSWDVELSPGAGIGFSQLHRVRREALDRLRDALLAPWSDRAIAPEGHPVRGALVAPAKRPSGYPTAQQRARRARSLRVVAAVSDLEGAQECLAAGCDEVHVPAWALIGEESVAGVVPVLPRVDHDREASRHLDVAVRIGRAAAATLGGLVTAVEAGVPVEAHWALNVTNPLSAAVLARFGATRVWLSPEVTAQQAAGIVTQSPVPCGIAIAGYQEVMVTEHCILMAAGECTRACASCERRAGSWSLRDRKGYEFAVRTDPTGRSHVYNSVALDLTASLDEVIDTGVDSVRIDLEPLGARDAGRQVRAVREALDRYAETGRAPEQRAPNTTTGLFFRGVR